jgi:preprotein translocase subunit SecD
MTLRGIGDIFRLGGLSLLAALLLLTSAAAEPLKLDIRDVQVGLDARAGQSKLAIKVGEAARALSLLTQSNVGRTMEVRIDGKAALTSAIREPLLTGTFEVSGGGFESYRALAVLLRAQGAKVEVEITPN